LHAHTKPWESFVDRDTGKRRGLRHREDHGRFWWELRPCAYYDTFGKSKLRYVDITWSVSFSLDAAGRFTSNTSYFVPSADPWPVCVLNAPAEILTLERKLSDLVNSAYRVTPDEVALMWRTAPPRMPLDPAEELSRLSIKAA
jgi:hypothetical protein